ncbi:MAG TPA: TonB-dependent receptor, partial [Gemmatimonadaceae bacterium]|nr:TonB-dependent receptor [Gemmatimonadaceae bacterium]
MSPTRVEAEPGDTPPNQHRRRHRPRRTGGARLLSLLVVALAGAFAPPPVARAQEPQPAAARHGVVRGEVVDAASAAPLAGAVVYVIGMESAGMGAATDDRGRFALTSVPAGTQRLRVRRIGYATREQSIVVPADDAVEVRIALTEAPLTLDPVRTRATPSERARFEQTPDVGVVTLSGEALRRVPAVGEPDVLRAAQLQPGVLARNDYTAGYNVRGGEADQNLILLDGIPVYNPFHLAGLFGTFIDASVGEVNLLTGGFPAPYGGRLSSVLDVTPAAEARSGVHGTAGVSVLASSLALGGAFNDGRTSWNVAGRRTYADKIVPAFSDQTLPYHFQDAQLHARHMAKNGGTLTLTAYAGGDYLNGSFADFGGDSTRSGAGEFGFDWGNQLVGLAWRQPFVHRPRIDFGSGKGISLGDSAVFVQRFSFTRFGTSLDLGNGSFTLDNTIREFRVTGSLSGFHANHARTLGYEVSQYFTDYGAKSTQTGIRALDVRQRPSAGALYYEDLWKVNDRVLVRAGLRGEYVPAANQWWGISPRASVKYFATRDLAFTLAGGQYAQWVHALRNEDVPVQFFDFWLGSDRNLPVSVGRQLVAGAERWFGDARFARVEAYGKTYSALAEQNSADDPLVAGDEFRPLKGTSYGVDVLLRQLETARALGGWVAYSYGSSRREQTEDTPGSVREFAPAQDRRHNLNAVASWRPGTGKYTFGARLGFGTGTPYTTIVGQIVRRFPDANGQGWDR